MSTTARLLELTEYHTTRLAAHELQAETVAALYYAYGKVVDIAFPTLINGNLWQFTPQGWIGYIPFSPDLHLSLQPKVPLANVFRMLEYAYRLKSIQYLSSLFDCQTLQEFYERLAHVLAQRVLDRGRKGLSRDYLARAERLSYVSGRLDVARMLRQPWEVRPHCEYQEHTLDIEDNQILAWTLGTIARSGLCTDRSLPAVRQAYRALQGSVTLAPFSPRACAGRLYNRLNQDHQPMHALCRFFLEHRGPSHQTGDHAMLPFLIDMAGLFELFVAEWLRAHLPAVWALTSQEHIDLMEDGQLSYRIDLVLYDAITGQARCVLDTKYKASRLLDTADVSQLVAYAVAKGCTDAALIYPTALAQTTAIRVGQIRVHTLPFRLDADLEQAGESLLANLQSIISK